MSDICILFAVGGSDRGLSDESEGAVGHLGSVGDVGAPLEIFREENTKVGAVDVNSLPSHGPHRLPPAQHHQLRFLELNTAVLATVLSRTAFAALNVSRDRFFDQCERCSCIGGGKA